MRKPDANSRLAPLLLCLLALPAGAGCTLMGGSPAPGRDLSATDPVYGRDYRAYIPRAYSQGSGKRWPLVVACHGSGPLDSPAAEVDDWQGLAERHGFLLVVPQLQFGDGLADGTSERIREQHQNERAILSIVRSLCGARAVDETRIFITGVSAGGETALLTGLRHPDVFRSLAVRQTDFDAEVFESSVPLLDPYQPINVFYCTEDLLTRGDSLDCIDWLHEQGLVATGSPSAGLLRPTAEPVYEFFNETARKHPRIRILARDVPDSPLAVRLKADVTFKPVRWQWDFGDGQGSSEATCLHQYDEPGQYAVRVAVWSSSEKYHVRQMNLQMPRVRLGTRSPDAASHP